LSAIDTLRFYRRSGEVRAGNDRCEASRKRPTREEIRRSMLDTRLQCVINSI